METRRPLRFVVLVDGREFANNFRSRRKAEAFAERLQGEAPWAAVEVLPTY